MPRNGSPGPRQQDVREEIVLFLRHMPEALLRPVPAEPVPFSTPRAWAMLADALDLAERDGILTRAIRRALAFGRVSAEDAAMFCAMAEESHRQRLRRPNITSIIPRRLPTAEAARWFILNRIRRLAEPECVVRTLARRSSSLFSQPRPGTSPELLVDLVRCGASSGPRTSCWKHLGSHGGEAMKRDRESGMLDTASGRLPAGRFDISLPGRPDPEDPTFNWTGASKPWASSPRAGCW